MATAGYIGAEFASAEEVALAVQAQSSQASQAVAKPQPKEIQPQAKPQPSQVAEPAQAKPAQPTQPAQPAKPEAKPISPATEPSQAKQGAEPTSQAAKQAEPSQEAQQPNEEIAERWARENLAEWLDSPCPFVKAQGRTWRELAENKGDKVMVNGKPSLPRAYLHALESWANGKVWQRMKARVSLEVCKNGNSITV